jgi:copper chaperone CopZ
MPTQKFWVEGLTHADEQRVAHHLRKVSGVLFAVLNHQDECAEVEFEDDRISVREIQAAIAELGYQVAVAG